MTRTHIRRVVGAFAALSLVATACGGSDDDGGGAASEPAATEASADEPAPVATEAAEIVVEAEEQPGIEQIMTMPEPQPPFEVIKHQDEMQMRRAELLLETLSRESDWINSEIKTTSEAMLNLAKAESEEAGIQYDEYAQQLEILREMAQQNVMRMKGSQGQGQPQGQQKDYSSMWR